MTEHGINSGKWRQETRDVIAAYGYQVNLLEADHTPRFAYTIGLTERGEPELLFAGALLLSAAQVKQTIDAAARLQGREGSFSVDGLGTFALRPVHATWSTELMLQAIDFYGDVTAMQIVPEEVLRTIDVPDASRPLSVATEPVWRWLLEPWPFDISNTSLAATDPEALRGQRISEASRWEPDYWEVFSGDPEGFDRESLQIVPISILLGLDTTLWPIVELGVGTSVRRGAQSEWELWSVSA